MDNSTHEEIFRNGSKTYYFSSRFFPKKVRHDVYILYGFVRVADNYVDAIPQKPEEFYTFRKMYEKALLTGEISGNYIIDSFIDLQKRKNFDVAWTTAFLDSMEHDLIKSTCDTLDETLTYIYGSAEVIGLFMAKIMDLDDEALPYAKMLGRAMQYINFIRDIQEDITLKRRYIPLTETSLEELNEKTALKQKGEFISFLRREIGRYHSWQKEASKGYKFIPRRYRIPIMTAADMYCWTGSTIARDPFIVFEKRVKPSKVRIIRKGFAHMLGVPRTCN
ncbi:MAG: phytoene/squalene synthase family protein [Spirochaetia bacterium]|nr:phytoene/squalene synthase family protein [Spirochaetia bacterium]